HWISVPNLDPEAALAIELPGARVLEAVRHPHKLRTGHLRGNRFAIRLRGAGPAARERASARCAEIARPRPPHRVRAPRLRRAGRFCAGGLGVRDRRDARFLVSAWQAEVFNAVLAARPVPLDELEAGDLAMRHDSGGVFAVSDPDAERDRVRAFEISPTGPVFGPRMTWPGGAVALRERAVMAAHGLDPDALRLPGVRARGARRALRVRPESLAIEGDGEDVLVRFELPAGSYATVVVEELFGPVEDASRAAGSGVC